MIRLLINIYSFIIIADALLSFAPQLKNEKYTQIIKNLAGYTLNPVRKLLPTDLPFDFSPLIVLVILRLLPALW